MRVKTQHSSPLDSSSWVRPLSTDLTACGREKGKPSTGSWFMMACSKATFREFLPVEEEQGGAMAVGEASSVVV